MRIVHFSDWHGDLSTKLPPADLYICTGDMLPDIGTPAQAAWIKARAGTLPGPTYVVRGNHDFEPLERLFDPEEWCTEFQDEPKVWEYEESGLALCGFRGSIMPPAWGWSDTVSEQVMQNRCQAAYERGPFDVLVTHSPALGVLDVGGYMRNSLGSAAMRDLVVRARPKLHLFGHIHESFGHEVFGSTLCVNSALGWHLFQRDLGGTFTVLDHGRIY